MDLFSQKSSSGAEPLASRMRPRNLEEYVGQDHILGEGRLLRRAIRADQLSSLIFYGPPGTGKTTLARVIANSTSSRFVNMNAVLSGVKELREAIAEAREAQDLYDKRTILFVDEVHRWNKSQQDALLPWVEQGTIILIGATTENPYFEVNKALVSRSRVFQLTPLGEKELKQVALQALSDKSRGYGKWKIQFQEDALDHLVKVASGDARSLLNALQLAVETSPESFPPPDGTEIEVSLEAAEESIQQKALLYDKEGDYHFDSISAFIKSIRGSDPDGALYWMARMIRAGEDPRFILRRLLISASEDIGMADPYALGVVTAAADAYDRVGLPEGQFHLTQAAVYLATCPKSNSALAYFDALDSVEKEEAQVPNHLKDSSRDKHSFGHGKGYKYPHAFRDHWVAQQYLPGTLKGRIFYQPTNQGYEATIQNQVIQRREEQLELMLDEPQEILTYSPGDKERDRWIRRLQGNNRQRLPLLEEIKSRLDIIRNDRVLLLPLRWNRLFWELFRMVPEGGIFALADRENQRSLLEFSLETLPESERPEIWSGQVEKDDWLERAMEQKILWEWIILEGFHFTKERSFPTHIERGLAPGGTLMGFCPLPGEGSRMSQLLQDQLDDELAQRFSEADQLFYQSRSPHPHKEELQSPTWQVEQWDEIALTEQLSPDETWIRSWVNEAPQSWGTWMIEKLGLSSWEVIASKLQNLPRTIPWERKWLIYSCKKSQ